MIEYRNHITRSMLKAEPDILFVFGDNFVRRGMGGQAKEMRGEMNAVGIPTKWFPNMNLDAFLEDQDWDAWVKESAINICTLLFHEGKIVWPTAGIGTGLAQLPQRAPSIWKAIERLRLSLEAQNEVSLLFHRGGPHQGRATS